MNRIVANVIVAIVFFGSGWYASREYMIHQMLMAFTAKPAETIVAAAIANVGAVQQQGNTTHPSVLDKIEISNPRYRPPKNGLLITAEFWAHFKNDTDRTLSSVTIQYALTSPGRKVPWHSADSLYFEIKGGLAPGEERDEYSVGNGIIGLEDAMKQHPEAQLSVSVVQARDENKKEI